MLRDRPPTGIRALAARLGGRRPRGRRWGTCERIWGCNSEGRRPPASCTPTPAATARRWCCTLTLSLPALATLIAECLTEWAGARSRSSATTPLPLQRAVQAAGAEDLFRSWIHPLRHNPTVRCDLPPHRPGTPAAARLGHRQRTFARPVLIACARDNNLMSPTNPSAGSVSPPTLRTGRRTNTNPNTHNTWTDRRVSLRHNQNGTKEHS